MKREDMESVVLSAMEDDANLQMLYDVWSLIKRAPSKAVDILMQFQDVSDSAKHAAMELKKSLDRYDELAPRISDLMDGVRQMKEFNASVISLDDDKVMNKLTRLVNMSKHLSDLKKDGTFEMLTQLMNNKDN